MNPTYLATAEFDQRQKTIFQAEKLREMLGASRQIAEGLNIEERVRAGYPGIEPVMRVSGVLRYVAEDKAKLFSFLTELRRQIGLQLSMPVSFAIVPYASGKLDPTNTRLEVEVRARKDARSVPVDPPANPFFAQCRVMSGLPANCWRPDIRQCDDSRRKLLSRTAVEREKFADRTRADVFKPFALVEALRARQSNWQDCLPREFEDLVASDSDSYIALLKADGDGLGRLLQALTFDGLAETLGLTAHKAAFEFSNAIEDCLKTALRQAVDRLTVGYPLSKRNKFPIVPLVRAGEDFWIVCRRDFALPLAIELVQTYARLTAAHRFLGPALQASGLAGKECLTLSAGVLFAKQGYPFDAQIHLAEQLVISAKAKRRSLPEGRKQGCIDYHWLSSSGRESLTSERKRSLTVRGETVYRLTQKPFPADDLEAFCAAARELTDVPRSKLHELSAIFRMGDELSGLRFSHWRNQLTAAQDMALLRSIGALPGHVSRDLPWALPSGSPKGGEYSSPLPDLVELAEIIAPPGPAGGREAAKQESDQ